MKKISTVHTSRTIMFKELNDLISHEVFVENLIQEQNVIYKSTQSNLEKTIGFLSKLYNFKEQNTLWKVFIYLWKYANEKEKRLMTILYALFKDDFLRITQDIVLGTRLDDKVAVEKIQKTLEEKFPNRYSSKTLLSAAQNIASSWKQAGYIEGKRKNIRVPINPGYYSVVFALYLGFTEGRFGEELLNTNWINILELSENKLREIVSEAVIRELIDYNYAGGVTVIRFDKLLNAIQ